MDLDGAEVLGAKMAAPVYSCSGGVSQLVWYSSGEGWVDFMNCGAPFWT